MSIRWVLGSLLSIASMYSGAAYAAQPDRVLGSVTGTGSITLPGTVHRKALPRFDQGPVDPTLRFQGVMLLTSPTLAQQRALDRLLAEQQDPSSPNYHRWLTPEQWADRFGLSQNDIARITTWLKSQGFTVDYVARGRNWMSFSGSAIQLESAFGTAIHSFNVDGELHVANAINVKIPTALSGIVTGIHGLNDFHLKPRTRVRPDFYDTKYSSQFLSPTDIATIYDITPLYSAGMDGTGQKVAVAGQTDVYFADINDFRTGFGLSAISCTNNASGVITACNDTHFKYVVANNLTDPGAPIGGDLGEADLDIEMVSGVARGAQIIYVNAPANASNGTISTAGVWAAWKYAVDNNIAPVISLSYGTCEFGDNDVLSPMSGDGADETELKKANSQGITFINSSGDSGAAECDPTSGGTDDHGSSATQGIAVSYPASSPEVTGVGGTATPLADFGSPYWGTTNTNNGSALEYAPEQAWNDDNEFAQYCSQHLSNTFCSQGGSTKVTGWKAITAATQAQTVQQDLALLPNGDGISSSGGGASNCAKQNSTFSACVNGFPQPSWQTVTVTGQSGVRLSPDVSFLASPNFPGYIFCTQLSELGVSGSGSSCASGIQSAADNLSVIGGTSASAPLFAGIVALVNQHTGSSQGNINPALYSLAGSTPGAFHDVSGADNKVYCTAGTPGSPQPTSIDCPSGGVIGYSAGTGYDLATGLGSVDVNKLVSALNPPFSLAPTAASFAVAQGSNIDATVQVTMNANPAVTITFNCTDPAAASICTAPPNTNASGQVSFHITTSLPTAKLQPPLRHEQRIFLAALLPGLLGVFFTVGSGRRRVTQLAGLVLVLGVSTLWLASCGGSNNSGTTGNPGTKKGQYTITVTGTSGASSVNSSFLLNVQ